MRRRGRLVTDEYMLSRSLITLIGFMVHDEDIPALRRRDLAIDGLSIIEYYLNTSENKMEDFCREERIHELYVFQMIAREENLKVNCNDSSSSSHIDHLVRVQLWSLIVSVLSHLLDILCMRETTSAI